MNFRIILLGVYLFGELKCTFASKPLLPILLAEDSKQKRREVKYATEKIDVLVAYRHDLEEAAQTESSDRIKAFEQHAGAKFSKADKPLEGYTSRLWEKAKLASDIHVKVKAIFKYEKFCYPPLSVYICQTVFEDSFFKNEKLTYDYSEPSTEDNCLSVAYSFQWEDRGMPLETKLPMQYKMCPGFKENEDKTKSPIRVYLQSAYNHRYKYFVIFAFIKDPATGRWQRSSDPNTPNKNKLFRYEAYLTVSKSKLKPVY